MRTPKHWKHVFFCKGTCFLRKKKASARKARNRRPNGVFFLEKKAPARNAWNRRPIGVPNLVRQITYFLEIVDLVSKKKFKPPSRWSISIISCGLNLFFWHQIHYFQEICDLVDRPGDIHQIPQNPFLLKTRPYRCYRHENTTMLMEITFRIQWDHSRIQNQIFQNKKVWTFN